MRAIAGFCVHYTEDEIALVHCHGCDVQIILRDEDVWIQIEAHRDECHSFKPIIFEPEPEPEPSALPPRTRGGIHWNITGS